MAAMVVMAVDHAKDLLDTRGAMFDFYTNLRRVHM